jgi:putative ABC transport system substrate-binding protein
MKRREFITLLGGAVAAWPLAARAQRPDRMRRLGVLMAFDEDDPGPNGRLSGFTQGLAELGWTDGRNVRMDVRWAAGNVDRMRMFAKELVDLQPDVILADTTPVTAAVQRETRTIPIVLLEVSDPIGTGFVQSFARPGGNITGFTNFEATLGGKWLELVREIAPSVQRVAMMFNPETANAGASGGIYLQSIEIAAHALNSELIISPVHAPADIDATFASIAQRPGGGLLVMPNAFTFVNRERIVAQAARYHIPTVYPWVDFVRAGGLLYYGVDVPNMFRRAASYVDRILRGAKPADLPVQAPTKFELVINLKTAKALGLTVPPNLLATADEVIE